MFYLFATVKSEIQICSNKHETGLVFAYNCRLLTTFVNSLEPEQARQNVGPDLGPSCLTSRWYSEIFEKIDFQQKNLQMTKRMQNYPVCKEFIVFYYELIELDDRFIAYKYPSGNIGLFCNSCRFYYFSDKL